MTRALQILSVFLFAALPASGAVWRSDKFTEKLPLDRNGSLSIENPYGAITIVGVDRPDVVLQGVRTVTGVDMDAVREGISATQLQKRGNEKVRFLRTIVPPPSQRWKSEIAFTVEVPRTAHVNVINRSGQFIRLSNITGNVFVKNVSGPIELTGLSGAIMVETVNGEVAVRYQGSPRADSTITSINGAIELSVPADAKFEWVAQTLRGEILSSVPIRGRFVPQPAGRFFRAAVNGGRQPKIVTNAVMGRAFLLRTGHSRNLARIQAPQETPARAGQPLLAQREPALHVIRQYLIQPPTQRQFQFLERFDGNFEFSTNLGNIFIGELTGNARVVTRAGEIVLGKVGGSCYTQSGGGPLNLGDIGGLLTAKTLAGDVLVKRARKGGSIATDAGNIQVLSTSGKIELFSGGGDVTVRQAGAPVRAVAHSGDITLGFDPDSGSQAVEAHSVGGNVVLNLPPGFGADIEATAITAIGETNSIQTDFSGLEVSSETIGDRVKTRAVGRINGGGEKILITTENGAIYLRSRVVPPLLAPAH